MDYIDHISIVDEVVFNCLTPINGLGLQSRDFLICSEKRNEKRGRKNQSSKFINLLHAWSGDL
jgi:hypothetical protein